MLVVEDGLHRKRTGLRTLKAKQSPINFPLLSFRIEQAGLRGVISPLSLNLMQYLWLFFLFCAQRPSLRPLSVHLIFQFSLLLFDFSFDVCRDAGLSARAKIRKTKQGADADAVTFLSFPIFAYRIISKFAYIHT